MLLGVQDKTLVVHAPVQVNRQLGYACHGTVVADKDIKDAAPVPYGQSAGEPELPIQPGVQERAALDLDA